MIFIRHVLTIGLFLAGLFCIALMIVDGFNWALTALAITALFFAWCFKPSSNKRDNSQSLAGEVVADLTTEGIVKGLFYLISLPFRALLHLLSH